MGQLLDGVRQFVESFILGSGPLGVGILMFLENLFPPLPSEIIMPFAGFLVDQGRLNPIVILLSGTSGAVLGGWVLFVFGKKLGIKKLNLFIKKYGKYFFLEKTDLQKALGRFEKNGEKIVFLGRLIPGIRSLISIPAGIKKMHTLRFLIYTTIGSFIWNAILLFSGFYLGKSWEKILSFIDIYEIYIWTALVVFALYKVYRSKFT